MSLVISDGIGDISEGAGNGGKDGCEKDSGFFSSIRRKTSKTSKYEVNVRMKGKTPKKSRIANVKAENLLLGTTFE